MSHTASESLPPDTATSTRSPGAQHVELVDRLGHLVAAHPQEVLGAVVGVLAPDVDDRRPAAHPALHRTSRSAARDDGADLDDVVVGRGGRRRGRASSPRITSTDSRLTSRRCSSATTVVGPRHLDLAASGCAGAPSRLERAERFALARRCRGSRPPRPARSTMRSTTTGVLRRAACARTARGRGRAHTPSQSRLRAEHAPLERSRPQERDELGAHVRSAGSRRPWSSARPRRRPSTNATAATPTTTTARHGDGVGLGLSPPSRRRRPASSRNFASRSSRVIRAGRPRSSVARPRAVVLASPS